MFIKSLHYVGNFNGVIILMRLSEKIILTWKCEDVVSDLNKMKGKWEKQAII